MGIYCTEECKDCGGCCDYCKHYLDDLRKDGSKERFAGEGICLAKNIRVDACDGCEDDFYCCLVDKEDN